MTADATGVYPGNAGFQRDVIDQEADFEVVGSVQDQVDVCCQLANIATVNVDDMWLDRDVRIDTRQTPGCGDRFG